MIPPQEPRDSESSSLVAAAERLRQRVDRLRFAPPVSHVYNPLDYAWNPHEHYLRAYGRGRKKVVFLGMNPGPFGMVQTGVPFGEINAVRNWLKILGQVAEPRNEHPKRPIQGFDCPRSEVSGRRLWGFFAERFGTAAAFFQDHFVLNYCPLAFLEATGKNRTPDKLPAAEREALYEVCDDHLREAVAALSPEWVIGIGDFAFKRAEEACAGQGIKLGRVLHPSPASPAANRDWAGTAGKQMTALGAW
jgi:single-strand selective monofunctional uracil DNA glycosylase